MNYQDRLLDYYYNRPGSLPGTLKIKETAKFPEINLINYDPDQAIRKRNITLSECVPYLENVGSITWVDVSGLGNEQILRELGEIFDLDQLLLEDVVNVPQRPKVEEHPQKLLIIAQMVIPKDQELGFWQEQVSLVLGENYLLTLQEEGERDCFDLIRDRIRQQQGKIRRKGSDYLAYALWDAIIDTYFVVLEDYRDRIGDLEEEMSLKISKNTLRKIYTFKRELMALRRAIWPQREALNMILKEEYSLISHDVIRYLRDCYDHAVQIVELIEIYHDLLAELMTFYLSAVANKTNEVMKVLTVISTIFIPLTFIAGIYGMNFNTEVSPWNMPELNKYWGYPICIGIMLVIAMTLMFFFWRRGWFKDMSKID